MRALQNFTSIADGGYVTFTYGCRDPSAWTEASRQFRNTLVLMDHHSFRNDLYPDYKSRRKEKRAAHPETSDIYEMVTNLREFILTEDTLTPVGQVQGAEADDLIAAFYLTYPRVGQVIAIDKDFQQVPGLAKLMRDLGGMPIGPKPVLRKMPKYVRAHLPSTIQTSPEMVLLQSLFGDKSDSIPRLLPSHPTRAKEAWNAINQSKHIYEKYVAAYELYELSFVLNVNLILVPGNQLRNTPISDAYQLFEAICSEQFWDSADFSVLISQLKESMANRLDQLDQSW